MNWDDLRFVLAVADHGSVSAAARYIGVTHATVLRRVAAFETAQGGAIFDKGPSGYKVREDCQRVIDAAREVADAVGVVDRLMHGARAPLSGRVRIASTDSLCRFVLPPLFQRMRIAAPNLHLSLLSSNRHVDVGRLQADLLVRPTAALAENLTGTIAAEMSIFAYSQPDASDHWLEMQGPIAQTAAAAWMEKNVAKSQITCGSDSFVALGELARLGLGTAALPAFVGDVTPGLVRRSELMPEMRVPIWVATHEDLSDSPRIRLAGRYLSTFLSELEPRLTGRAPT